MAPRNKIMEVKASELKIHPIAQRKLVAAQLNKRMADLDLDAIGVLQGVEITQTTTLTVEGETYVLEPGIYVIDGQHRVISLCRHGFGDWKVRVELHPEAVDVARASALFLRLNARATVAAFDMFKNQVQEGNPDAVGAQALVEKIGMSVRRQKKDGQVACVSALKRLYAIDEGKTLEEVLMIVREAYGKATSAYEAVILDGLAIVVSTHNGTIDRPTLIKKLAKYPAGASGIIGDARGLKKVRRTSMSYCVSETIVEMYNQGRRSGRLSTK